MSMKVKIGIDGNEANNVDRVGIGQYAHHLLKHIYELVKDDKNIQINIYLKNQPIKDLPPISDNWKYQVFGPKFLWTQLALPMRLTFQREKPKVFFSPTHYAPRFCPCKRVISVMDLSYLRYPEMFLKKDLWQLKNWTSYSIRKSEKIFTISQFSKDAIISNFNVSENKVIVTYPGYDKELFKPQYDSKKLLEAYTILKKLYGISGRFILYVGTIQPRKNILNLVKAFQELKKNKKNRNLQLIIVGKHGWLYKEIINEINKFSINKDIILSDYISDDILIKLYQSALGFILPSFYEGFGLPVVEAMACGCPVAVSNRSSLPEIVGEAGLIFDPDKIQDIMAKLDLLISNNQERNQYIKKGLLHVKKFDWRNCAETTLQVLLNTIKHEEII